MRSLSTTILALILIGASCAHAAEPVQRPKQPRWLSGIQVTRDIPYINDGHQRQRLDLYRPKKIEHPLPIVVWIHGGAWKAGDKRNCPAVWLAAKGYAVASVNYRLSQDAVFPAQIQDCKAAIRWLRASAAKYHLDPRRVGVWGASAGGHLVALLGTTAGVKEFEGDGGNPEQSSRVQAVVDWFGPSDFMTLGAHERSASEPLATLLGGLVSDVPDKARQASPLTHVSKDAAPFLIMQGDQDKIVLPSHSERLAAALKAAGVEVQLEILKGAGHGGPAFKTPERRRQIEDFFDKHLAKATPQR